MGVMKNGVKAEIGEGEKTVGGGGKAGGLN